LLRENIKINNNKSADYPDQDKSRKSIQLDPKLQNQLENPKSNMKSFTNYSQIFESFGK